jgi:hypothetical protein
LNSPNKKRLKEERPWKERGKVLSPEIMVK